MSKKPSPSTNRDPGVTIRVPLELVQKLREKAKELPANPLLTEQDVVTRLAQRALAIGVESARLIPRE